MKNILQGIFLTGLLVSVSAAQVEVEVDSTSGNKDSTISKAAFAIDSASQGMANVAAAKVSGNDVSLASVKMNSPLINIQLLMNLLSEKTEFVIEYSGSSPRKNVKPAESSDKKGPTEKEISSLVSEAVAKNDSLKKAMQDSLGRNSYSKEDAEYNKAMVKLNSAQRLFSRKRYADALREIDGAISSAPNIALSHSVKGSIHYMLKQNLEAKASWEKALELDPTQDNVRAILLRMY